MTRIFRVSLRKDSDRTIRIRIRVQGAILCCRFSIIISNVIARKRIRFIRFCRLTYWFMCAVKGLYGLYYTKVLEGVVRNVPMRDSNKVSIRLAYIGICTKGLTIRILRNVRVGVCIIRVNLTSTIGEGYSVHGGHTIASDQDDYTLYKVHCTFFYGELYDIAI